MAGSEEKQVVNSYSQGKFRFGFNTVHLNNRDIIGLSKGTTLET